MKLELLSDSIAFTFVQEISAGSFDNQTSWGFTIKNKENDVKVPRWGVVLDVGPDVKNVKKKDYILIEPLMWTSKVVINDINIWRTTEPNVIGRTETPPSDIV
jgi:hypothetical protein